MTYTIKDRNDAAASYRNTMTNSQLMTAVSKAERRAAATAHSATLANDADATLNADAVGAERALAALRAALWEAK